MTIEATKDQVIQSFTDFMEDLTSSTSLSLFDAGDLFVKSSFEGDGRRIFKGWGSVQMKDNQGEEVDIEGISKVMGIVMKRGGVLLLQHSNRPVGKIVKWDIREKKTKDGTMKDGLWLEAEIFKDYIIDDKVWSAIKSGWITGFSIGGSPKPGAKKIECEGDECFIKINEMELYEVSIVDSPANPEALIEEHAIAKSDSKGLHLLNHNDFVIPNENKEISLESWDIPKSSIEKIAKDPVKRRWPMLSAISEKHLTNLHTYVMNYVQKNDKDKLDAHTLAENCPHCKRYVEMLKVSGVDEADAMNILQKKLNKILEEKQAMAEDPTKQEEGSDQLTEIIQQFAQRLDAIEEKIGIKQDEKPPEEEETERPDEEEEKSKEVFKLEDVVKELGEKLQATVNDTVQKAIAQLTTQTAVGDNLRPAGDEITKGQGPVAPQQGTPPAPGSEVPFVTDEEIEKTPWEALPGLIAKKRQEFMVKNRGMYGGAM